MKKAISNWQALTLPFNNNWHEALQQQHYAAQLLALAGKYLIPQQPDDSNTSMRYLSDPEMLATNELANGLRLGLKISTLELQLLDAGNHPLQIRALAGVTFTEAFDTMQKMLKDGGVDTAPLVNQLHYEIPGHPLATGAAFEVKGAEYFKENAFVRHNCEIVLQNILVRYSKPEPVRVWPHHFDTGTFIPLAKNDQGVISKSIGLGWALPDTMVNEPYFYLSFWSQNEGSLPTDFVPLPAGEWMMPGWNGAVLPHSEILKCEDPVDQHQYVRTFFDSGIKMIEQKFK
jgi:hypothetical protein